MLVERRSIVSPGERGEVEDMALGVWGSGVTMSGDWHSRGVEWARGGFMYGLMASGIHGLGHKTYAAGLGRRVYKSSMYHPSQGPWSEFPRMGARYCSLEAVDKAEVRDYCWTRVFGRAG